jgi:hypothetical protein
VKVIKDVNKALLIAFNEALQASPGIEKTDFLTHLNAIAYFIRFIAFFFMFKMRLFV